MRRTEHLPSSTRNFQHAEPGRVCSCSFLTGAYVHGNSAGITNNARRFPLVTSLIEAVIRSVAPCSWFSSAGISLNLKSGAHRDSNNSAIVPNTLIPASDFLHGELCLEDGSGTQEVEGFLGRLVPVSRPSICFNPRIRHATSQRVGNRLVLIGYHARNPEFISASDKLELRRMGFQPMKDADGK